jgi:hypothetical protein
VACMLSLPQSCVCNCPPSTWGAPGCDPGQPTGSCLLPRCGLALALNKLSQYLDSSQVKPLFQFFVPDALNDRNPDVRKCMLDAALATLNAHGKVSR